LLAIGAAFGFIYSYVYDRKETRLKGKWKVSKFMRNHQEIDRNTWEKDSTAWNTVYFETHNQVVFCPNPYRLDRNRSTHAQMEEKEKDLKFMIWNRRTMNNDTARAQIVKESGTSLILTAFVHRDTLELELERVKN
jgi:hypothetical protein